MLPAGRMRSLDLWWAVARGLFSPVRPAFAQSQPEPVAGNRRPKSMALSVGGGGTAPVGLQRTRASSLSQWRPLDAGKHPALGIDRWTASMPPTEMQSRCFSREAGWMHRDLSGGDGFDRPATVPVASRAKSPASPLARWSTLRSSHAIPSCLGHVFGLISIGERPQKWP
jgi:hypothetical protein